MITFRWSQFADLIRDQTDQMTIATHDLDQVGFDVSFEGDASGALTVIGWNNPGSRPGQFHLLQRDNQRPIVQNLLKTFAAANDHVVEQSAGGSVQSADTRLIIGTGHRNGSVFH